MLDIKTIRTDPERVREGLRRRGADPALLERVLELDERRRRRRADTEAMKNRRNTVSRQIGLLRKEGRDTAAVQEDVRRLGADIAAADEALREIEASFHTAMLALPNLPCATIPTGTDAIANREVRREGAPPGFDFEPRGHVELGSALGIFDFARAARMSGTGFPLLKGDGARLQRALIQYMLDCHVERHGYTEILPPFLVNDAAMTGTGQLPKMAEDMYRCERDELWLIPTAEVPLTNFHREEILQESLPVKYVGYTPCFRREAGSAGRDTRGMIRVHQFDKVEMVQLVHPDESYPALERLLADAEDVLRPLELHYRILELCSGDISFAAAKCYDIELWAPGQKDWLEVSSCSNFEDFQARRAGIRFRDARGKTAFVHTLNGSGVALPRLMVALLENGQRADGRVELPAVLAPYLGGRTVLAAPS